MAAKLQVTRLQIPTLDKGTLPKLEKLKPPLITPATWSGTSNKLR